MEHGDWKNHPVILMGGSFLAGVGFALTVIMPTHIASLQERISHVSELEQAKVALEKRLDETRSDLFKSEQSNPFLNGSPYPNGLERVKSGDNIDRLSSIYPSSSIEKTPTFYVLKDEHVIFKHVAYFFDEQSKITKIIFGFEYEHKFGNLALLDMLTRTFGMPATHVDREGTRYEWIVGERYELIMLKNDSYHLRLK